MSKHIQGQDCTCAARSQHECACDAAWTSTEVYELRARVKDLEKQIAAYNTPIAVRNPTPCQESTTRESFDDLMQTFNSIWGSVFREREDGRGGSGGGTSFNIQYNVELVPQQTGMSCWAAGAAMLVGWYDRVSIDPEEIASQIGYWAQYDSRGLDFNDIDMANHWHLKVEPAQSYTVEGFVTMLGVYGPLWVGTMEGGPHVRVVAGAQGDATPEGTILTIYDPWQQGMRRFRSSNTGSVYQETFAEWQRKNNELAESLEDEPAPVFVLHN